MDLTAEQIWEQSKPYWIAVVEEFAAAWRPNGPSEHVKDAFVSLIRRTALDQARAAKARGQQ